MELIRPLRKKNNSDDNLIPLINIVFLLLIFFMVAGQMQKPMSSDITLPISQAENNTDARLHIEITASGRFYVDGKNIRPSQLAQLLPKNNPDTRVLIKADKNSKAAALDPLLNALAQAGIEQVQFLTEEAAVQ